MIGVLEPVPDRHIGASRRGDGRLELSETISTLGLLPEGAGMARRRFDMHHYLQSLLRMRQGDSDRDIAAARVMDRPKAAQWRHIARSQGWGSIRRSPCRTARPLRRCYRARAVPPRRKPAPGEFRSKASLALPFTRPYGAVLPQSAASMMSTQRATGRRSSRVGTALNTGIAASAT